MKYFIYMILGYLSGSVMYAYLIPKIVKHIDVRELSEDGNPGAANAFLHAGIPVGIVVILCELLKGAVPVWAAARSLSISHLLFAPVMAAPVLGHAFPLFFGKKGGGKAIAVSFGVLIGLAPNLNPALTLAALYILFSLIIVIKPHFFRSVITFLLFAVLCILDNELPKSVAVGGFLLSGIVIRQHFIRYKGEHIDIVFPIHRLFKSRTE